MIFALNSHEEPNNQQTRLIMKKLLLTFLLILPAYAQAGAIFLSGDSNIFDAYAVNNADNEVLFQNVFNGESVANYGAHSLASFGTTATETFSGTSAPITAAGLAGKSFMIFGYTRSSVSASELSAIADFKNNGGSLFLYGEGNDFYVNVNVAVNQILAAVGSTMTLSTLGSENYGPGGYSTVTDVVGVGPYAAGVNTWITGYTAGINLGSGVAVISGTAGGAFGTAIAMEGASVPAPGILALLSLGLFGMAYTRKRKLV